MKINTKSTQMTVTPAISEYVDKRLAKISRLLGDDPSILCDVELAKTTSHHNKGEIFRAEIHIVGAGKNFYSSSEKSDLYTAIDDVQDQILSELTESKDKQISLMRRGGAKVKAMVKGLWPWSKKGI